MPFPKLKYYLIALAIYACYFGSKAQNTTVDSLEKALGSAKQDSTRLRLYLALGEACEVKDNLKYGKSALDLSNKLLTKTTDKDRKKILKQKAEACEYICAYFSNKRDFTTMFRYKDTCVFIYVETKDTARVSRALYDYFNFYSSEGNIPRALEYCQKGLSIFKEMNYKKGISDFLERLGGMYRDAGINDQALENYQKSLAISIELKDTNNIAGTFISCGDLYSRLDNTKKAAGCYQNARLLFEKQKNNYGLRRVYESIGLMHKKNHDLQGALENFEKSLLFALELPNKSWLRRSLSGIGNIYAEQGDFQKALDYHYRALKVAEKEKDNLNTAWVFQSLAQTYLKQNNYRKAKYYSDSSLAIIRSHFVQSNICIAERLAAKVDSGAGNFKEAYAHYQKYIVISNNLSSEEVNKAAAREKFQTSYDRQKAYDIAQQEKKDILLNDEMKRQKIVRNSLIGGFVLVLILAIFIFRSYRQKQRSNMELAEKNLEIQEKNKDILDSIRYAKRIQNSLLPTQKYIERVLNEKDKVT